MLKNLEANLSTLFETIKLEKISLELKENHQLLEVLAVTKNPIQKDSPFNYFRNFLKAKLLVFTDNVFQKAKDDFWDSFDDIQKESFVFESQDIYKSNSTYSFIETEETISMTFAPKLIFPRPLKNIYFSILLYVDYEELGNTQNITFEDIYEFFGAQSVLVQLYDENYNPKVFAKFKPFLGGENFVREDTLYQGAYVNLTPKDKFDITQSGAYGQINLTDIDWVVGSDLYNGKAPRVATEKLQFLKGEEVVVDNITEVILKEPVLNVTPSKDEYSVDVYPNMLILAISKSYLKDELTGNLQDTKIDSVELLQNGSKYTYLLPNSIDFGDFYYLTIPNELKKADFELKLDFSLFSTLNQKKVNDTFLYIPQTTLKTVDSKRNVKFLIKKSSFRESNKTVNYEMSKNEAESLYQSSSGSDSFFKEVLGGFASQVDFRRAKKIPLDFNKTDLEVTLPQAQNDFQINKPPQQAQNIKFQELVSAELEGKTLKENWRDALFLQPSGIYRVSLNNSEEFRFISK